MRIHRTCAALAWSVGVLCGPQPAAAAEPQPVETFVFVGERLSIEEAPDPCEQASKQSGEPDCITMDSLYTARYRVLEPIAGAFPGELVEFNVADHYGFPPFARFGSALLFVALSEEGPWLHKYQAIPVHRAVDGQWASCGDIRFDPAGKPSPQLRTLSFRQEVALESELSEHMLASYRAGEMPHWRIAHGKVWCSQGILLEHVYEAVRSGVMQARGIPLPAWTGRASAHDAYRPAVHPAVPTR
ncbi:hypothetical protein [Luteimonas kalidii]|uniref:Uncharacterized protein n=1 Tax=Luteimonas kalidii TaxID=3042025 RepID=A0ABT6JXQ6_9GAMM|nr:hypothetical protein [Luteimonas kalidii]MDH5835257.1 hypothetical protein [Luteimonas kalidii]